MVFGMGVSELAVILLVVLVIFGPKNLPKLGSTIGKTVKNIREGMEEEDGDSSTDQVSAAVSDDADQESPQQV